MPSTIKDAVFAVLFTLTEICYSTKLYYIGPRSAFFVGVVCATIGLVVSTRLILKLRVGNCRLFELNRQFN